MGTTVPGLKLADDEHRQLGMRQHAGRLAAEDHPAEPGTVVEVYQQGFRHDGVVLRPARVVVAA